MMMSYDFVVACSIVFTIVSMNLICYFYIDGWTSIVN